MISSLLNPLVVFCCSTPFLFLGVGIWGAWKEHFKITYIPFMNNRLGSFILAEILLLIPISGLSVGFLLASAITPTQRVTNSNWVLLPKSSQRISNLRAADFYIIYAETIDGKLVSCYYQSADDYDCWREVWRIPKINKGDVCFGFPDPPAGIKVIDKIRFEDCMVFAGMEDINESNYVLSDDGRVYRSSYGIGTLPPSKSNWRDLLPIAGLLTGLIIDFKVIELNKKKNTFTATSG